MQPAVHEMHLQPACSPASHHICSDNIAFHPKRRFIQDCTVLGRANDAKFPICWCRLVDSGPQATKVLGLKKPLTASMLPLNSLNATAPNMLTPIAGLQPAAEVPPARIMQASCSRASASTHSVLCYYKDIRVYRNMDLKELQGLLHLHKNLQPEQHH